MTIGNAILTLFVIASVVGLWFVMFKFVLRQGRRNPKDDG